MSTDIPAQLYHQVNYSLNYEDHAFEEALTEHAGAIAVPIKIVLQNLAILARDTPTLQRMGIVGIPDKDSEYHEYLLFPTVTGFHWDDDSSRHAVRLSDYHYAKIAWRFGHRNGTPVTRIEGGLGALERELEELVRRLLEIVPTLPLLQSVTDHES